MKSGAYVDKISATWCAYPSRGYVVKKRRDDEYQFMGPTIGGGAMALNCSIKCPSGEAMYGLKVR
ncbi:MAG: hypothetical protein H6934_13225 [Burkholderiaceae bacterium]|nr:hypothetical protein [Burkholderiaceae bacterium]